MAYQSKVTDKKRAIVAELKDQLTTSKGAVLTGYKGLTVAVDTELRRELRAAGVTYHVVKNTMTRFAAQDAGLDELTTHLEGTTGLAFSKEDPVAPAKVICGFMKKNKQFLQSKPVSSRVKSSAIKMSKHSPICRRENS